MLQQNIWENYSCRNLEGRPHAYSQSVAPGKEFMSLIFLSCAGGRHVLVHGLPPPAKPEAQLLSSLTSFHRHIFSLTLTLLPLSYKDPGDYTMPSWIIQKSPHLKVLNWSPFQSPFCHVTCKFGGFKLWTSLGGHIFLSTKEGKEKGQGKQKKKKRPSIGIFLQIVCLCKQATFKDKTISDIKS